MTKDEAERYGQQVVAAIKQHTAREVGPLITRIAELEKRLTEAEDLILSLMERQQP